MSAGVPVAPVAAPDLASDHRATQLLFGEVVGGRDFRIVERTEELQAVLAQVLRELAVLRLRQLGAEEPVGPPLDTAGVLAHGGGRQLVVAMGEQDGLLQEQLDRPRKADRSPALRLVQLPGTTQEVAEALGTDVVQLVERVERRQAVGDQRPGKLSAQDIGDHLMAAAFGNDVDGCLPGGEDPQPSGPRVDPPAGIIRLHHGAVTHELDQCPVGRCAFAGNAQGAVHQRRVRDRQSKVAFEHGGDVAVGNAQTMLELGGQAQHPSTEAHSRRACRPRDLGGMSAAHLPPAAAAPASLGHHLLHLRPDLGQVHDELLQVLDVGHFATALRAAAQRREELLVHVLRDRLPNADVSRAAPWPASNLDDLLTCKGSRLPLGPAQPLFQLLDPSGQVDELPPQSLVVALELRDALVSRVARLGHRNRRSYFRSCVDPRLSHARPRTLTMYRQGDPANALVTVPAYDFSYDEVGRLVAVATPTGESAQYVYDPAGNIVEIRRFA